MSSAGIWTSIAEHPTSFAVTGLDGPKDGNEVAVDVAAELLPKVVSPSAQKTIAQNSWTLTGGCSMVGVLACGVQVQGGSSPLYAADVLGSTCLPRVRRLCSS